jgi:signal transduction histidine kinase
MMQLDVAKTLSDDDLSTDSGSFKVPKPKTDKNGTQMARSHHNQDSLKQLITQSERLLGAKQSILFLKDPAQAELAVHWISEKTDISETFLEQVEALAGQICLQTYPLPEPEVLQGEEQLLAIPLYWDKQMIGVWILAGEEDVYFSQTDTRLLNLLAHSITVALENVRLQEIVLVERERLGEAENESRRKLADRLHDGPTQLLSAIIMHLELCALLVDKDSAKLTEELTLAKNLAQQVEHQARTMLFELRPLVLETKGLVAATEAFLERYRNELAGYINFTLKVEPHLSDGIISRQDNQIETALFAIIQEAVNNAVKYAQADQITVYLRESSLGFYTMVSDNGQGFEVDEVMTDYEQRGSLGLLNIRERAELIGGELTLKSIPGRGTYVIVYVPKTTT